VKPSFFSRKSHRVSAPIFVSAKRKDLNQVILFADWNYNILDQKEGWNFYIEKVKESKWEWHQKIGKLFWRGTPWDGKHFGMYSFDNWTRLPRGRLVAESKKYSQLIDAAFSEYPSHCARQDISRCVAEMGKIQFVPWEEVFHYKYQMIIDGVTCTFPATYWKLLSGSLCLKQESDDIQFYSDELIAWIHYVPVKHDLSDLKEKIIWAKTHDAQAQEIAVNAKNFAQTHLMPSQMLLYCYKVLCKYASLQKFQPRNSD
jgi:hypothetical protein